MGLDGTYGQRAGLGSPGAAGGGDRSVPAGRGGAQGGLPLPQAGFHPGAGGLRGGGPGPAGETRQTWRPGAPFDLVGWLGTVRDTAVPGVYRFGHVPRLGGDPEQEAVPGPVLLGRAALNLVVAWLAFWYGGGLLLRIINFFWPVYHLSAPAFVAVVLAVDIPWFVFLVRLFGRMGRWREVWRRYAAPVLGRLVTHEPPGTAAAAEGAPQPAGQPDPWAELRGAGSEPAVAVLDEETRRGAVGDVDYVRIQRAWEGVLADPSRLRPFAEEVAGRGAAACAHPSTARDLPERCAEHDLLTRQVRLGTAQDVPKNPVTHRGAGFALDPELLGTSMLVVGPAGTGKTRLLARPVVESLCLQALANTACVVAVGALDADLGPDRGYDVVIAPGDPGAAYGLDLYGGSPAADEAAARLADALLPDELVLRAESARTTLQQVVGPFHSAHGRYPGLRELRELLAGEDGAWDRLREALDKAGRLDAHRQDLAQRARQHGRVDDPGALLADRLALLDRPAFAGCFNPSAGEEDDTRPPFAMRALDHPLRVRVKLPEQSHPEAARILARLVVGQFVQSTCARRDRSLFAGLVVDDASGAVDAHLVRGLQRMRGVNAGALLQLRSLADLPEALRAPLFGAVGCRMAFPGLAPWDGRLFSEAWGTVWVQEKAVTHTPDTSGGLLRRSTRAFRSVLAGTPVQTESVTTRPVERQLWSSSDLAHGLPAGHAVVSLTTVSGAHVPPLLVDLRT